MKKKNCSASYVHFSVSLSPTWISFSWKIEKESNITTNILQKDFQWNFILTDIGQERV